MSADRYITDIKVNPAFHSTGVGKLWPGLKWGTFTWVKWQVTFRSSVMGFLLITLTSYNML